MKVKSESEVAQSCLTLSDPMDYSPPSSSVHGIFQARVLEWGAIAFSSVFPSIRVFFNESALRIRWPNYWSFSFSISLFNEHSGLVSFRMDWLDLLAVQGTLKSLLASQLKSIHSVLSLLYGPTLYMTTGKTIALTIQTFVGKVMSLLFNTLTTFVIGILPRSKHLLILWLQSPSALILEPKKMKSDTVPTLSPSVCHEVIGQNAL